MCNELHLNAIKLSISCYKNFRSIGCLPFTMKFHLKDIDKNNRNILIKRNIYSESPKQRSNKRREIAVNKQKTQTNYEILGINPNADQKQIKTAYFMLSKTCHPDVNKTSEAKDQFREITDAYEVLANKESKRVYDSTIANHLYQQKPTNADINQQNLNNYRTSGKFGNNFTESEDYLRQKLNKRRTIRMGNVYEKQKTYRKGFEDPLRHDSKDYFKTHFNDDLMKEYSEQIEKMNKQMESTLIEHRSEANIKLIIMIVILTIPLIIHLIDTNFRLSEPPEKVDKSIDN